MDEWTVCIPLALTTTAVLRTLGHLPMATGPSSMLSNMSEISTGQSVHGSVTYTGSAYTELQEVIRPQGGDLV